MKIIQFKLIAILVFIPFLVLASHTNPIGKHTKEKSIHKEYEVSAKTKVEIWNMYGNVNVTTWEGDKIVVDIQVSVNGDDLNLVSLGLNKIDFDISADDSMKKVSFTTKGYEDIDIYKEINYQIKMPKNNSLSIMNFYGDVIINEIDADVNIATSYGNVIAGKLNGASVIGLGYSQKSSIAFAENLELYAHFSEVKVDKANRFVIKEMKSSNISAGDIMHMNYEECEYGSLDIGKTKTLRGDGDYLTVNVKEVEGDFPIVIKAKYGSLNIDKWNNTNANFDIYGTRLTLGYSNTIPFDLNLIVKGCIIPTTVGALPKTVQSNLIEHSEKEYSGFHLNKNSGRQLNIKIVKGILRFNEVN